MAQQEKQIKSNIVKVEWLRGLGKVEKGTKAEMHVTTARALEKGGYLKITGESKVKIIESNKA